MAAPLCRTRRRRGGGRFGSEDPFSAEDEKEKREGQKRGICTLRIGRQIARRQARKRMLMLLLCGSLSGG